MHRTSPPHRPSANSVGLLAAVSMLLVTVLVPLQAQEQEQAGQEQQAQLQLAVIDIDAIGYARLSKLQNAPGISWWVELDDQLLVASPSRQPLTRAAHRASQPIAWRGNADSLFFLRTAHRPELQARATDAGKELAVVAEGGGYAVVRGQQADFLALETKEHEGPSCGGHSGLWSFSPNRILARQEANAPPRPRNVFGSGVQSLVDAVDGDRWFADIQTLSAFNRYTHGSDIPNARDWLVDQFSDLPGLSVTTETFEVFGTAAQNVIATLTGNGRPDEWYIVGAHYDSISQNPQVTAPGAEDNASGCAGVLELARIFAQNPPEATIFFICYSGEEQGLFGSTDHASKLVANGNDSKVQGALIMDMIGYSGDSDLDSLLEANSASQSLINAFADAAAQYTTLRIVTSLNPFGSDHVPYLNRGMKSLLTIENDWDSYPGYHRVSDLPDNISLAMGSETLKMNVAALALMVGSSANDAIFSDGFEAGDLSAWSTSSP